MAILSVEVPDIIASRFKPYEIVQLKDLSIEDQLLREDGEGWETVVDFGEGVDAREVLSALKTTNG